MSYLIRSVLNVSRYKSSTLRCYSALSKPSTIIFVTNPSFELMTSNFVAIITRNISAYLTASLPAPGLRTNVEKTQNSSNSTNFESVRAKVETNRLLMKLSLAEEKYEKTFRHKWKIIVSHVSNNKADNF